MTEAVLLFVAFYVYHLLGVTVGYHRLLAHRSFKCPKLVEYFFVTAGYLAFESSPIWWATLHRAHHRYTETELDPHSPRFGNTRAYLGWIFGKHYPEHLNPKLQAPDLVNDPLYRLLERNNNWHASHLTNTAIGFGSRLILWALFGWEVAALSLAAGLTVQQVPFMVNLLCHKPYLGYKNYDTSDDSTNVPILTLMMLGENWHNNHHAYPGCARNGFRWYEFDVSWLTIKSLSILKLATNVNDRFSLEREVRKVTDSESTNGLEAPVLANLEKLGTEKVRQFGRNNSVHHGAKQPAGSRKD
ncbi:MAG: fatty acid desaturase [Leptolyngbya sp.]|nr:fatty acid desaturase [Candidatus Melainabacteria bacterium]